jgi:hypothetical protein
LVIVAAFQVADVIWRGADPYGGRLWRLKVIVCNDGSTDDLEGAPRALSTRNRPLASGERRRGGARGDRRLVPILNEDDVYLPERIVASKGFDESIRRTTPGGTSCYLAAGDAGLRVRRR